MSRALIAQLRHHMDCCSTQDPVEWCEKARELVEVAAQKHPGLNRWLQRSQELVQAQALPGEWQHVLAGVLRELNQTEQVNIFAQPMVQLTIAGILFMIMMTLLIIAYYFIYMS